MASFIDHPQYAHIEAMTESFVSAISSAEADFYITHGYYFQGWPIPDGTPDGTEDLAIDNTAKPFSQAESWKDFQSHLFKNNTQIPFRMQIQVLNSKRGYGWRLIIEVWYPGLDPDEYGNYGDHWVFIHDESYEDRPDYQVWDNWYITDEEF